jgi:(E)-4-hydroxy-3-methylbut-2-enyl-diphosphate synthase
LKSKIIQIGALKIGGKNLIAIQSMLNTDPTNFSASAKQIKKLLQAGCEIIRIAVPNEKSLTTLKKLRNKFPQTPLVADIHYSAKFAIAAIALGMDKIRINPGNFPPDKLAEVVLACRQKNIPIRVGVNSGSLEKKIKGKNIAEKLANSALSNAYKIEKLGYRNLVLSVKSSDVQTTIAANRLLSRKINYPLHLGITEAGSKDIGTLKSAVGLGSLLCDGIGNTIRISLTADPIQEVAIAWNLLKVCGLRKRGVEIISCPTCGRTEVDLIPLVAQVERALKKIEKPMTVAVMGCAVNGPGEASHADFALVGGCKMFGIYCHGKFVKNVSESQAVRELTKLIFNF